MCEHLQSMVATERTPELKFGALKNLFLSFARGHDTWCHYTRYLFITDVMKEVEVLSELEVLATPKRLNK